MAKFGSSSRSKRRFSQYSARLYFVVTNWHLLARYHLPVSNFRVLESVMVFTRFNLRTVLLVTAALGGLFAYFSVTLENYAEDQQALERLIESKTVHSSILNTRTGVSNAAMLLIS